MNRELPSHIFFYIYCFTLLMLGATGLILMEAIAEVDGMWLKGVLVLPLIIVVVLAVTTVGAMKDIMEIRQWQS